MMSASALPAGSLHIYGLGHSFQGHPVYGSQHRVHCVCIRKPCEKHLPGAQQAASVKASHIGGTATQCGRCGQQPQACGCAAHGALQKTPSTAAHKEGSASVNPGSAPDDRHVHVRLQRHQAVRQPRRRGALFTGQHLPHALLLNWRWVLRVNANQNPNSSRLRRMDPTSASPARPSC
jgi:hypothetical protein